MPTKGGIVHHHYGEQRGRPGQWTPGHRGVRRGAKAVVIVAALGLTLAACGSSSKAASSPTSTTASSSSSSSTTSSSSTSAVVAAAKKVVAAASAKNVPWDGPTTGPKAVTGKSIVFVASDLTNTGVDTVLKGVEQAAKVVHWSVKVLNGDGTTEGQSAALSQAIALKPDGIVIGGFDYSAVSNLITEAHNHHIAVVGWNAATSPGPSTNPPVFYNVAVSSKKISEIAADYAIAKSDGHANVVIFTDNEFAVAKAKADDMEHDIEACSGCKVLAYKDTPLAEVTSRMPPLTTSLLEKYGSKWTYSLAINDSYYRAMGTALAGAGISPSKAPINISAGDGSPGAFQRIRTGKYQAATVAAPLNLQGWQVIDELNRAFHNDPPDNYVATPRLVIKSDIAYDGGPQDAYIPNNHYEQHYEKIWGVSGS
jgi:ribose transport system substrate-binding protein